MTILALLLTALDFVSPPSAGAAPSPIPAEIVSAINAERSARGLQALSVDNGSTATDAAQAYMDTGVPHPAGYDWVVSGDLVSKEISVAVNGTSGEAVRLWMGSDGHRIAVLDASATKIRVGVSCRSDGRMFAVAQVLAVFGAAGPMPAATPVVSPAGGSKCGAPPPPPPATPVPPSTPQNPGGTGQPATRQDRCFTFALADRIIGRTDNATVSRLDAIVASHGRAASATAAVWSQESLNQMVSVVYSEALGRSSDTGGLRFWTGRLSSTGSVAGVMGSVFGSAESYRLGGSTNNGYVTRLYGLILDRTPEAGGLNYWSGQINSVGREAVADRMLGSNELKQQRITNINMQLVGTVQGVDRGESLWILTASGELGLMAHVAQSQRFLDSATSACPR